MIGNSRLDYDRAGAKGQIGAMPEKPSINEVDFCGQIASAAIVLINQNPSIYPFNDARVEGYGTGTAKRKRKDLRFYGQNGKLVLCGEVKLPGTQEGRSALNQKLVADAAAKADDAGVQYFFTWNVNEFALWDRSLWDRPWQSDVSNCGSLAARSADRRMLPERTISASSKPAFCPICCAT